MGIQNPQIVRLSLPLNPSDGRYESNYYPLPDAYRMTAGHFYNPLLCPPLRKVYPQDDSVTPVDAHHRVSRAGVPWECPIRVMYGGMDRYCEISGLPGATIGRWYGVDEFGNLQPDNDTLNIYWSNPIAGTYNVVVRVWDQLSSVTFRFTHVCGLNWLFGAPSSAGLADGSSPADPMAWADVYKGYNVVGPSKGKTLCLLNGFYPAPEYDFNPAFNARNMVSMHGQTAQFSCKFNDRASDRFMGRIEIRDVDITASGLINTDSIYHRLVDYKCRFINITKSGITNNQACRFTVAVTGQFRKDLVSTQGYYENCTLTAVETYSIENHLIDRETYAITNPAITIVGGAGDDDPVWMPKGGIKNCEMSWLKFDNPTVAAGTEGIIKPYAGATNYGTNPADQVCTLLIQNCFVRCNGGEAVMCASASNGPTNPITANIFVLRNTVIGGKLSSYNYDASATISRSTRFDRNVIQNIKGGVETTGGVGGYTVTNAQCHGTSGIVDANGNLTGSYLAYLGTNGEQVRK
jgi:hypothetical protein